MLCFTSNSIQFNKTVELLILCTKIELKTVVIATKLKSDTNFLTPQPLQWSKDKGGVVFTKKWLHVSYRRILHYNMCKRNCMVIILHPSRHDIPTHRYEAQLDDDSLDGGKSSIALWKRKSHINNRNQCKRDILVSIITAIILTNRLLSPKITCLTLCILNLVMIKKHNIQV